MSTTDPLDRTVREVLADVRANRAALAKRAAPSAVRERLANTPAPARLFENLAANENAFADHELPTAVPPDRARHREWLAMMCAGRPITVAPKAVISLDELEARREAIITAARAPSGAVVSPVFMLEPPANDNHRVPQSWPLAEALRRDNREADIEICEIYRGLWSVMAADPLQGRDPNMSAEEETGINQENRGGLDGHEHFKATGEIIGTGEIEYHEVRQIARSPGAGTKAVRKGDGDSGARYRPTASKFSEQTLIAQIDMRDAWDRMRTAIRPLLSAFEEACLDGATLTEIGEARDFKGKQASAAGKAMVYAAIATLQDEWCVIQRESRAREYECERNVLNYRSRLVREVSRYLGRAA